jgi:hypothetical protein
MQIAGLNAVYIWPWVEKEGIKSVSVVEFVNLLLGVSRSRQDFNGGRMDEIENVIYGVTNMLLEKPYFYHNFELLYEKNEFLNNMV